MGSIAKVERHDLPRLIGGHDPGGAAVLSVNDAPHQIARKPQSHRPKRYVIRLLRKKPRIPTLLPIGRNRRLATGCEDSHDWLRR